MDGLQNLIDAVEDKIYELEGGSTTIESSETFKKVLNDPKYELGDPDDNGDQEVYCCGKKVGWINANKGEGQVDEDDDESEDSQEPITAAGALETREDLKQAIEDALTSDECFEIVNDAFGDDGTFEEVVFIDSNTFFDTEYVSSSAKTVAKDFFEGADLDDDGPANPNRAYFRINKKKKVESTDYPGDVYLDTILDDIVEYVLDYIDDKQFPDYIQDIIDEYQGEEEE